MAKEKIKVGVGPFCCIYRKGEDGKAVLPEVFKHDKSGWHLISESEFGLWGCQESAETILGELDQ